MNEIAGAQAPVSGSIYISSGSTMWQRQIQSNSDFFQALEDYIIKVDDEKIIIRRTCIDDNCRTYKATKHKYGWVKFQILAELPLGKFEFDYIESDIDVAVIYYR